MADRLGGLLRRPAQPAQRGLGIGKQNVEGIEAVLGIRRQRDRLALECRGADMVVDDGILHQHGRVGGIGESGAHEKSWPVGRIRPDPGGDVSVGDDDRVEIGVDAGLGNRRIGGHEVDALAFHRDRLHRVAACGERFGEVLRVEIGSRKTLLHEIGHRSSGNKIAVPAARVPRAPGQARSPLGSADRCLLTGDGRVAQAEGARRSQGVARRNTDREILAAEDRFAHAGTRLCQSVAC